MDLKQLAASLLGAVNAPTNFGANINDTATNGAELGNIRNLSGLYSRGDIAKQATGALGGAADQQAANESAQAKAAAQAAADEEDKKRDELKRLTDPNQFKSIVNDAGGYDFYDPLGQKISAVDYARKKNLQLTDVYKDSQDPNDKDFIDDYKKVNELGKAIQNHDAKARDKIYADDPSFKEAYHDWTYSDIVKDLHKNYPGYFRGQEGETNVDSVNNSKAVDLKLEDDKKKKNSLAKIVTSLFG